VLTPGRSFGWEWTINGKLVASIRVRVEGFQVVLSYRHKSGEVEWEPVEQHVLLEKTPCAYGGVRHWFRCPRCSRRVAIIYGAGPYFACRHCHNLAYACQRENTDDRAARRADTIRRRLGWDVGILNASGGKPQGMHWKTYYRLRAEHDAFVGVSLAGMARRLGMIEVTLDGIRKPSLMRDVMPFDTLR
jgi:hypothetical protein